MIRRIVLVCCVVIFVGVLGVFAMNEQVGKPLRGVLHQYDFHQRMDIRAHYKGYLDRSTLVIDVKSMSQENSFAEVFGVLMAYAAQLQGQRFETVILASRGKGKFKLSGFSLRQLGHLATTTENPLEIMHAFPEMVYLMNNRRAYPEANSANKAADGHSVIHFIDFHSRWYAEEIEGFAFGGENPSITDVLKGKAKMREDKKGFIKNE